MRTLQIVLSVSFLILLTVTLLNAQDVGKEKQAVAINKLMSPSGFKSCGLHKLSNQELARLNEWLHSYTLKVADTVRQKAAPFNPNAIISHVKGDFHGWKGDTIVKLDNGQIWQQASNAHIRYYMWRPEVIIYRKAGRYIMNVQGIKDDIYVRRLK